MLDWLAAIEGDQFVGIGFLVAGAVIFIWGLRHVRATSAGPAAGLSAGMMRAGARLWQRMVGAALIVTGGICALSGIYLILNVRSL